MTKLSRLEDGEMAVPEDPSSVPSTYRSGGSKVSVTTVAGDWSHVCTPACRHTHLHVIKKIFFKFKN